MPDTTQSSGGKVSACVSAVSSRLFAVTGVLLSALSDTVNLWPRACCALNVALVTED